MRNLGIQHLPGLRYIGWLNGANLKRRVDLDGIVGQPVPILTELHEIDFCGKVECSCKSTKEGNTYSDTATLKFFTASLLPFTREKNVAFVVTDIAGRSFLIGSKEMPCTNIIPSLNHGFPDGDEAGFLYEIRHVACKSMVPCVISRNMI